jgi:hypothetical protein
MFTVTKRTKKLNSWGGNEGEGNERRGKGNKHNHANVKKEGGL